ncbi:ABC transporter ATP-binding protein [Aminipila sp.]|uniref:ABC transporter ATP-binding protein n=1 Tax=Aminipila sp. TaxID=2060095 RepID=UPI002F3E95C7
MNSKSKASPPVKRRKGHGPMGMMPGEKAENFKETMKTLMQYMRPFKLQIIAVIILPVASTAFSIISPMILGMATDAVVQGVLGQGIDYSLLKNIIMILISLYIISFGFSVLQSYIMAGVSQTITYRLRKEISEKLDRLPLRYFDSKSHGEILSRVTNDVETVNQSLAQSMTQMITSTATIVGVLAMMIYLCVTMTIAALIVIPLSLGLIKLVVKFSQGQFKNQQKALGEMNGHVEEMYTGHLIVKAFNKEEASVAAFNEINEKLYESAWKSQFLSGTMMPLVGFAGNLAYVFVCVAGGWLAIRNVVSIGNIQAFMQYVRSFNQPISQISNIANILQSTAAAAERVFEFLDEEEEEDPVSAGEEDEAERASKEKDRKQLGKVCFEHVKFGYDEEHILIQDFTFEVKPGQRIAIVGPTGAGKTTIVKLLLRFYELNGGRIVIDGKNIKDYTRAGLRKMFGMVLQDTWLFNGSIMDNIRYGKRGASDEEVCRAAKAAHVHHFIMTQPKGYQMEITEDADNISQGQKQLLTIARAFLADAPILILDEATSSVDTRTEAQIQKAMTALMANRTSFVIAHRLSTIRDADIILVINHGDIVEFGSHEELLSQNGFYADMYNSQFEK